MKSSAPVRVAVFLTNFEPGGTEHQMFELIRRLDPSRFDVHVACFHREGAWLHRFAERAASIVEFPIRSFKSPFTLVQLLAFARWCRRERIAVVQTCDFYANIFGLPGASLAAVPVRIGSRRELNPGKSASQILLQRHAYRCATKVVANSTAAGAFLLQEGLAAESIAVIPNGVDTALFREPNRDPAIRPLRCVVTVANLRPEKDHETLIAAAAMLVTDHPELHFQIVGGGPRRQELEALVRTRHLENHVTFLGHREDIEALLEKADVFVLPSRSEALPNSVMEAMAAGLPVVASATGGLLDLIEDGRTGMLVPPGDPNGFAGAIRRLVNDRPFAQRLGDTARACIKQRYAFESMVRAFEDLYVSALPASSFSGAPKTEPSGV